MNRIVIADYSPAYQKGIDFMMKGIAEEFPLPISSAQSTRINEVYKMSDQKFWVALHGEKVVGTAGLNLFSDHNAVLKRMMVDKDYRGREYATAKQLLDQSFGWARQQGIETIFLGTMDQFKAAQKFYLKQGFTEIKKEELPADYNSNPIDTLFYKIRLKQVL